MRCRLRRSASSTWSAPSGSARSPPRRAHRLGGERTSRRGPLVEPVVGGRPARFDEPGGVRAEHLASSRLPDPEARGARRSRPRSTCARPRRSRGRTSPCSAASHQRSRTGTVAASATAAAAGIVEERGGERERGAPPRVGERVDHPQLEPPLRPDRGEERAQVVGEVVGRGPTELVAAFDPLPERQRLEHGLGVVGVDADEHDAARRARSAPTAHPRAGRRPARRTGQVRTPARCGRDRSGSRRPNDSTATPTDVPRAAASWRTRRAGAVRRGGRGPSASSISSGAPVSRLTCSAAVPHIIVRPAGPPRSKYASIAS